MKEYLANKNIPGILLTKYLHMAKSASNIKKERFKSVASRRVQKVLDDLESLSKCGNKSTYEYSEEDVRKMIKAITDKVTVLKISFSAGSASKKQTFEF